jgi:hypothetical protein
MTQNQTKTNLGAIADLQFQNGWNLSPAGTANPLRYWSHVHFNDDPKWGQETWTLFVELDNPPCPQQQVYRARVFFMAPMAPHHFLQVGQEFDLCVGIVVKAHGIVKEVCL